MNSDTMFLAQVAPSDDEIAWADELARELRRLGYDVFQEWPPVNRSSQPEIEQALRRAATIVFVTDGSPTDLWTLAFHYGMVLFGDKVMAVVTPPGVVLRFDQEADIHEHQVTASSPHETAVAVAAKINGFRRASRSAAD